MPRGKKPVAMVSKLEATRQAVKQLGRDVTTARLGEFLKAEFQIEMSPKMLATYRGTALKQLGGKKRGPKPGTKRAAGSVPVVAAPASGGSEITVDDIRAVKAVADKIGAEKVWRLAGVLG
jgi:hypothetical protein